MRVVTNIVKRAAAARRAVMRGDARHPECTVHVLQDDTMQRNVSQLLASQTASTAE